jgi:uncharacterized protein (TIGR02271 family)
MAKTVVGLFEDRNEAQRVVDDLTKNGFNSSEITTTSEGATANVSTILSDAQIPDRDVRFYNEGVQQGDTLITVRTSDDKARRAADIMSRYNMVDLDTRANQYRQSGRTDVGLSDLDEAGTVLPVIEEELQVGKRQVQRGGVRIHSHVTERPVEEQVTVRHEKVNVERRPVDREVGDVDANAFQDRTFEVTETAEEPVVAKRARVIEEVVVGKTTHEHTRTVSDTVRRTDVDVEQLGAGTTTGTTDITGTGAKSKAVGIGGTDDNTYYQNYFNTNLKNSGYTFDQYQPVFSYGQALGTSDRYRGKDWSAIEPDARREWEARNPGTWEEFKDSVRYAWARATGKR